MEKSTKEKAKKILDSFSEDFFENKRINKYKDFKFYNDSFKSYHRETLLKYFEELSKILEQELDNASLIINGTKFKVIKFDKEAGEFQAYPMELDGEQYGWEECNKKALEFYKKYEGCVSSRLFNIAEALEIRENCDKSPWWTSTFPSKLGVKRNSKVPYHMGVDTSNKLKIGKAKKLGLRPLCTFSSHVDNYEQVLEQFKKESIEHISNIFEKDGDIKKYKDFKFYNSLLEQYIDSIQKKETIIEAKKVVNNFEKDISNKLLLINGTRFKVLDFDEKNGQIKAFPFDCGDSLKWSECKKKVSEFYKKFDGCVSSRLFTIREVDDNYELIEITDIYDWWVDDNDKEAYLIPGNKNYVVSSREDGYGFFLINNSSKACLRPLCVFEI